MKLTPWQKAIPGGGLGIFDGVRFCSEISIPEIDSRSALESSPRTPASGALAMCVASTPIPMYYDPRTGRRLVCCSMQRSSCFAPSRLQLPLLVPRRASVLFSILWPLNIAQGADNPSVSYKRVQCPANLVARTGCKRPDDASQPVFAMPGGNTAPAPSPPSVPAPPPTAPAPVPASPPSTPAPAPPTTGCSPVYGQCGGNNWTGPKCCAAGSTCKLNNEWRVSLPLCCFDLSYS